MALLIKDKADFWYTVCLDHKKREQLLSEDNEVRQEATKFK